jgi:hypothetical protein
VTRHKDFSSGAKIKEPLTFTIDKEEFTARSAVPGALLLEFVTEAGSDDPTQAADALIDFFALALVSEDVERFTQFIRDPDRAIQIETLAEIVEFLVEQFTSKNTQAPSPLPTIRKPRARSSGAKSSSTAASA